MIKKRDFEKEPLEVLSYGGGVQSTAMILMCIEGMLPIPDIIIHSDTGAEMPYTLEILDRMKKLCHENNIPFVIVESTRGAIDDYYLSKQTVPVIGFRSCTDAFKIAPQRQFIRQIVGSKNGVKLANVWLGITTDEAHRNYESDVKWVGNRFPLLDAKLSRSDCVKINEKYNFSVKKSGCYMCPYGGKKWFIHLYRNHPDLFEKAKNMELAYQKKYGKKYGLVKGINDLNNLRIHNLFSFGGEILPDDESSCDSGGCFI